MRAFLPLLLALSVVGVAQAQTVIINRPPTGSVPAQHQRVTVNVTLATPATAGATSGDITENGQGSFRAECYRSIL